MKVLGVSTGSQAAAALSVGGRVVAAATEDLFARHRRPARGDGWPQAAISACLSTSGVALSGIDRMVTVIEAGCGGVPAEWLSHEAEHTSIQPFHADARQVAAAFPLDESLVYVLGFERDSHAVFHQCGPTLKSAGAPSGGAALAGLCELVKASTGCDWTSVALGADDVSPDLADRVERALRWDEHSGFVSDETPLREVLCDLKRLRDAAGDPALTARYQHLGHSVAAAMLRRLQHLVVESAQRLRQMTGTARIGFGGAVFSVPAVATTVVRAFGSDALLAPVPEHAGRALGAALHHVPAHAEPVGTLALGPAFSEQDVKATLDSCRLTYIYEPEWGRLRARVSRVLSGGMLVAWFQGGAGFGSGAVAGRAVVCDPSNRWARENVNRFFRQVPVETPVPLLASTGNAPWRERQIRRFTVQDVAVGAELRNQVVGAVDRRGRVDVQGISASDDLQLHELIREHQARTGVPALMAVPFRAPSEPVVCAPRDAVRAMFSSAIDVLVMERFIVAKDHWLLGTQGGQALTGVS